VIPAGSRNPTRPTRRRSCRVCELPASELDLLNGGLLAGWSPRSLALRFTSLTRRDVQAHMRNCVASEAGKDEA
jgi:hypothetical protein